MRTSVLLFSVLGLVFGAASGVGCGQLADVPGDSSQSDAGTKTTGGGTSGSSSSNGVDTPLVDGGVTVKKDAGIARSAGRCAKDLDCGAGGHCVELTVGGYRVCSYPPPAPEECTTGGGGGGGGGGPGLGDECCGTCAGGATCTLQTSCGGAFINPHNVCVTSECAVNADCGPSGVCLPTGVGSTYARTCMTTNECLHHTDCTAAPNGICALAGTIGPASECSPWTCGGGSATTQVANGLTCIYGSECSDDADCPKGHCEKVGGRPICQAGERSQCPPPP